MLAHVDAGKTTLTEQMLFQAGAVRSLGRVDDGSAHTDFTEFERRRGISVRAASAFLSWNGAKIYVIDTPGHSDFSGETERAARAMDFAAVAVSVPGGFFRSDGKRKQCNDCNNFFHKDQLSLSPEV